jgi:hypothetical protein
VPEADFVAYTLPDRQRAALAEVAAAEAAHAKLYARRMRARHELNRLWEQGPEPDDFAILELAGTARIGQSQAATELSDSTRLVEVFPTTLSALQDGIVFEPAVALLLRATRSCSDQVAAEVERRMLPRLLGGNTTELRRLLRDTVLQAEVDLDADAVQRRERAARDQQAVWISPREDGMCQVGAFLDDLSGRRWCLDFEELVRAQASADKAAGIARTRNQRRAAVFAALPSQLLALLAAIANGDVQQLQALARREPGLVEDLEALADTVGDLLPTETTETTETPDTTDTTDTTDPTLARDERIGALLRLTLRDPKTLTIHIPVSTVLDLDNRCGWIEGVGPISPHRVRMLLPTASLQRVLIDRDTGIPLHLDPTVLPPPELLDWDDEQSVAQAARQVRQRLLNLIRPTLLEQHATDTHDPTRALAAFIALRDVTCTGPGCSMPGHLSHNDHEVPWPDGPTAEWNLSAKSARCHLAKHHGWTVHRDEHTGDSTWRSPLGHTYFRTGVWQAPTPPPPDAALTPAKLLRDIPGPVYNDTSWNEPLTLPEPTADPEPPARATWEDEWKDSKPPF